MKTDAVVKTKRVEIRFKPYEGEKLKSTTEYFLFHIFETMKSYRAAWTTYAIDGVYIIINGMSSKEKLVMEITKGDKTYRLTTFLTPDDIVEVFDEPNEFIEWCDKHGEVFLCERKREVFKNLEGLSKQNKWILRAKLIAYHQLWWNR